MKTQKENPEKYYSFFNIDVLKSFNYEKLPAFKKLYELLNHTYHYYADVSKLSNNPKGLRKNNSLYYFSKALYYNFSWNNFSLVQFWNRIFISRQVTWILMLWLLSGRGRARRSNNGPVWQVVVCCLPLHDIKTLGLH